MAVSPSILFATMLGIKNMRDAQGIPTNMRMVRTILEYSPLAEDRILDKLERTLSCPTWMQEAPVKDGGHGPSCWINKRGTMFPIGYGSHANLAQLLTGVCDAGRLEEIGWVHVSGGRIDRISSETPEQRSTIETLLRTGLYNDGLSYSRQRGDSIHPAFETYRNLSSYDWLDPRYWEARGIPRSAHSVRPRPNEHLHAWKSRMDDIVYNCDNQTFRCYPGFNPEIVQYMPIWFGEGYVPLAYKQALEATKGSAQ